MGKIDQSNLPQKTGSGYPEPYASMMNKRSYIRLGDAESLMGEGDCASFPAGVENGHHFLNKSEAEARFLVIGTRAALETVYYSDVDMMVVDVDGVGVFTHKDGSPLPEPE